MFEYFAFLGFFLLVDTHILDLCSSRKISTVSIEVMNPHVEGPWKLSFRDGIEEFDAVVGIHFLFEDSPNGHMGGGPCCESLQSEYIERRSGEEEYLLVRQVCNTECFDTKSSRLKIGLSYDNEKDRVTISLKNEKTRKQTVLTLIDDMNLQELFGSCSLTLNMEPIQASSKKTQEKEAEEGSTFSLTGVGTLFLIEFLIGVCIGWNIVGIVWVLVFTGLFEKRYRKHLLGLEAWIVQLYLQGYCLVGCGYLLFRCCLFTVLTPYFCVLLLCPKKPTRSQERFGKVKVQLWTRSSSSSKEGSSSSSSGGFQMKFATLGSCICFFCCFPIVPVALGIVFVVLIGVVGGFYCLFAFNSIVACVVYMMRDSEMLKVAPAVKNTNLQSNENRVVGVRPNRNQIYASNTGTGNNQNRNVQNNSTTTSSNSNSSSSSTPSPSNNTSTTTAPTNSTTPSAQNTSSSSSTTTTTTATTTNSSSNSSLSSSPCMQFTPSGIPYPKNVAGLDTFWMSKLLSYWEDIPSSDRRSYEMFPPSHWKTRNTWLMNYYIWRKDPAFKTEYPSAVDKNKWMERKRELLQREAVVAGSKRIL